MRPCHPSLDFANRGAKALNRISVDHITNKGDFQRPHQLSAHREKTIKSIKVLLHGDIQNSSLGGCEDVQHLLGDCTAPDAMPRSEPKAHKSEVLTWFAHHVEVVELGRSGRPAEEARREIDKRLPVHVRHSEPIARARYFDRLTGGVACPDQRQGCSLVWPQGPCDLTEPLGNDTTEFSLRRTVDTTKRHEIALIDVFPNEEPFKRSVYSKARLLGRLVGRILFFDQGDQFIDLGGFKNRERVAGDMRARQALPA